MADDPNQEKSIEMRLAAIEDKLAQMSVTEDELKAYHKVAGLMGGGAGAAAPAPQPQAGCVANCVSGCLTECLIRQCTIVRSCTVLQCTIIRACTYECLDCTGPCNVGGLGGAGGAGFGGLGG